MKTDKEWMQIEQTEGHPHILCPSIIRAIQLDAMKEGMRRAASMTRDVVSEEAILSTAEQLTERDLTT